MTRTLFAADALLPTGWAKNVLLAWDDSGRLTQVQSDAARPAGASVLRGPLIPGMPNLHSHAFQRAMAGLAEVAGNPNDSFWTWRDLMYRMVGKIRPDQLQVIARQLYIEMLKAGYTSVAEFHYVHHDVSGQPYADPAELSRQISQAAASSGIGLTLLPVLGLGLATLEARAEAWPTKPLRAIVPVGAGSTTDIIPRVVFEQLAVQLGQSIVVENRTGVPESSASRLITISC